MSQIIFKNKNNLIHLYQPCFFTMWSLCPSSLCLFIISSFSLSVLLSSNLVGLRWSQNMLIHLISSQSLKGGLQCYMSVELDEQDGMEWDGSWLSQVMGLPRAPLVLITYCVTLHNVQFVKYDVTVSFMAQVLDTVTYLVPQVLDTAS